MTRDQIVGAFTAWRLAIEEVMRSPMKLGCIRTLAEAYGSNITTDAALDHVHGYFDWEAIGNDAAKTPIRVELQ